MNYEVLEELIGQGEGIELEFKTSQFELSKDAISWIAEKGFDERMGARPLGRVIQEYVKKPLADEVLFGKLKKGGTVTINLVKDKAGKKSLALEAIEDVPAKRPKRPAKKTGKSVSGTNARISKKGGKGGSVPKMPLKT